MLRQRDHNNFYGKRLYHIEGAYDYIIGSGWLVRKCPRCGFRALSIESEEKRGKFGFLDQCAPYWVECHDCHLRGPEERTKYRAVARWNELERDDDEYLDESFSDCWADF